MRHVDVSAETSDASGAGITLRLAAESRRQENLRGAAEKFDVLAGTPFVCHNPVPLPIEIPKSKSQDPTPKVAARLPAAPCVVAVTRVVSCAEADTVIVPVRVPRSIRSIVRKVRLQPDRIEGLSVFEPVRPQPEVLQAAGCRSARRHNRPVTEQVADLGERNAPRTQSCVFVPQ